MTEEITMTDIVTITCYGKTEQLERDVAIKTYLKAMVCSEGSERERYSKILGELMSGQKVCSDE